MYIEVNNSEEDIKKILTKKIKIILAYRVQLMLY